MEKYLIYISVLGRILGGLSAQNIMINFTDPPKKNTLQYSTIILFVPFVLRTSIANRMLALATSRYGFFSNLLKSSSAAARRVLARPVDCRQGT